MVSIYKTENVRFTPNGKVGSMDLRGLSTDEKPTTIGEGKYGTIVDNGSSFIEIDTGKIYLYDFDNETWDEVA